MNTLLKTATSFITAPITSPIVVLCIALPLAIGSAAMGWIAGNQNGIVVGKTLQSAAHLNAVATQQNAVLADNQQRINDANAASTAMRGALAARNAQDDSTTKDFKQNATQNTAPPKTIERDVICRFNDSVMQQLNAARDRAAHAAAYGISDGIHQPMPSTQPLSQ